MSAIASALVYTVNFVNLFARRHHLFDIAATDAILIPLKSIQIICLAVPYYYYYYYFFFILLLLITKSYTEYTHNKEARKHKN